MFPRGTVMQTGSGGLTLRSPHAPFTESGSSILLPVSGASQQVASESLPGGDSRGQRTEEEPGCPTQLGSLTILFSASRGRYPLCSTSSAPNCFLESACFNPHLEICQCGVFGKEGAKCLYEKARLGLPWVRQRLCRVCNIYLSS